MPSTRSGWRAPAAISAIGRADVFEAKTASAATRSSTSASTRRLSSTSSKTASITMSAPSMSPTSVVSSSRDRRRSASTDGMAPDRTWRLRPSSTTFAALARTSSERSRTTTGHRPSETEATPAPMKPPPRTASRETSRASSPSECFLASFMAWKRRTRLRLSGLTASFPKYSLSRARPANLPLLSPVSTQSRIAGGAGYKPRVRLKTCCLALRSTTARPGAVEAKRSIKFSFRGRRFSFPSAKARAARAPVSAMPPGVVTASTRPILFARRARTRLPVSSMGRAATSPTRSISRWVPPPAGSSPSITSDCASTVLGSSEARM